MRRDLSKLSGIILVWLTLSGCERYYAHATLVNDAGAEVRVVRVSVGTEKHTAGPIPPGERRRLEFEIRHDSDYLVEVQFADGTRRVARDGYLTRGFNDEDSIIVLRDTILVGQNAR